MCGSPAAGSGSVTLCRKKREHLCDIIYVWGGAAPQTPGIKAPGRCQGIKVPGRSQGIKVPAWRNQGIKVPAWRNQKDIRCAWEGGRYASGPSDMSHVMCGPWGQSRSWKPIRHILYCTALPSRPSTLQRRLPRPLPPPLFARPSVCPPAAPHLGCRLLQRLQLLQAGPAVSLLHL